MSSISAISGAYPSYSPYSVISNGGKIQKAAEDAAGLAIQEKTDSQVRGLDAGSENLKSAKSALNIEDGALDNVTDYLQSIRELSIQAKNGTLSDDDRKSIQDQIDQFKQGIEDIAGNTTNNEKNLLNGANGSMSVATDGNGASKGVSTFNSTLKALGIEDYDVTKDFDIASIDKALESVAGNRSTAGAETNGVDYALTYNSHAALELNGYQMDREEERSMNAVLEMKNKQVLDLYQTQLQNQKQKDEEQRALSIFA